MLNRARYAPSVNSAVPVTVSEPVYRRFWTSGTANSLPLAFALRLRPGKLFYFIFSFFRKKKADDKIDQL